MHDVAKPLAMTARRETKKNSGSEFFVIGVMLMDAIITMGALSLAWWLRFRTGLADIGTPELTNLSLYDYWGHITFGTVLMSLTLANYRAYDYRHLLNGANELKLILKSVAVWVVVYMSLSLILKFEPPISRIYCVGGAICIALLLTYWRLVVVQYVVPNHAANARRRKLLLVGWNEDARRVTEHIHMARVPEYDLCGVVLRPGQEDDPDLPKMPRDLEVVGTYEDLESMLDRENCDAVLISDLELSSDRLRKVAEKCEREMVDFQLIPGWFPTLLSGLSLQRVSGVPVLGVSQLPLHSSFNNVAKRVIDIFGALIGLALSAPLIAAFGMIIYRESPGPIFYRQRRMGLDGRSFDMIKLRSMKLNAEAGQKVGWTVKDDPRRLKIGTFMRSWNIDEIPQFWNVLKGDMSLVGPRPERPELIQQFKEVIPHYNSRHNVKPGITGWAQVNGLRGDTDLGERVRFDLTYIENWNLLFDVRILFQTFFTRKGAC